MRFTVTWHPSAEAELADIWMRTVDRNEVTRAANEIDELLSSAPIRHGEEFCGDRILVVLPLAVTFTINEPDCKVQILQVWHR
jgi:hypothetical protein